MKEAGLVLSNQHITILGIGNLVRQDEGAGIHLLQALEGRIPPEIERIDGGTMGFPLLGIVEAADKLLLLDAVDAGLAPGSVVVWKDEEVPSFFASKMSVHQVSFAEILNIAKLNNACPSPLAAVGIQPHTLGWGMELSETVTRALPEAAARVQEILAEWTA